MCSKKNEELVWNYGITTGKMPWKKSSGKSYISEHGNFLLLHKVPESEDEIEEELVEKKETVLCELQGNGLYEMVYIK